MQAEVELFFVGLLWDIKIMTIYYDKQNKCFYDSRINIDIPANAIEINENQHVEILTAINSGCVIFDDLTQSEPRPSIFHNWNGSEWVLNEDAKKEFIIQQNHSTRDALLVEATTEIDIINRAIRLKRATISDKNRLTILENYTIDLYELDLDDMTVVFPEKP